MTLRTLLVVVAVATGNLSPAQDWSCRARTYARNAFAPVSFANLTWQSSWNSPQDFGAPIIVGDSVYARRVGGPLTAPALVARFRAPDGAMVWQTRLDGATISTLTYWQGLILFGAAQDDTGYLYALDAATGAVVARSTSTDRDPIALPSSANSARVYQPGPGRIYWHDVRIGTSAVAMSTLRYRNVPFIQEPLCTGRAFYGWGPDGLQAFDRTDGQVKVVVPWRAGLILSPLAYSIGTRALVAAKGQLGVHWLQCYSVMTDASLVLKWEVPSVSILRTPVIDETGDVYVMDSGGMSKFDGATGSLKAHSAVAGIGFPVVTKSNVFIQDHTVVRILDRDTLVQTGLLTGLYTPLTRLTTTAVSNGLVVSDHDSEIADNLGIRAFVFGG